MRRRGKRSIWIKPQAFADLTRSAHYQQPPPVIEPIRPLSNWQFVIAFNGCSTQLPRSGQTRHTPTGLVSLDMASLETMALAELRPKALG